MKLSSKRPGIIKDKGDIKMKTKIYVAGSFATREGVKKVLELQDALRKAEFEVLNQLEAFDYTRIKDFRAEMELGKRVIENDLSLLKQADVIVALADQPSFGIGAEVFYAKHVLKKKVIAIASKPARSPWIVSNADVVLKTYSAIDLIKILKA
jgi:nucleoside 2-deoxyribosyltransferase